MFAGLDDVDWVSMGDADAEEVPALLRGLVADDPAVREHALSRLWDLVLLYDEATDSGIAAIPFLLEAAVDDVPGRDGVLQLLARIAGDHLEGDEFEDTASRRRRIEAEMAGAGTTFVELLADPDVAVRRCVPHALMTCPDNAAAAIRAMQHRFAEETDHEVCVSLLGAIGAVAQRAYAGGNEDVDPVAVAEWLIAVSAGPIDLGLRMTALAVLASLAPDRLPPEATPTALEVVEAAGDGETGAYYGGLVAHLARELRDRVPERIELLCALLRSPALANHHEAAYATLGLIRERRGTYDELIALIGEHIAHPDPRLRVAAMDVLRHLEATAAPAADALAASLNAAPRWAPAGRGALAWVLSGQDGRPSFGPTLTVLASVPDPRAVPVVRWALEEPDLPSDLGIVLQSLGEHASPLAPLVEHRLRDLPRTPEHDDTRGGLALGLVAMGECVELTTEELVATLPSSTALYGLGQADRRAAAAIPALHELLDGFERSTALEAAKALWRIEGDPEPLLTVYTRFLNGDLFDTAGAADGVAEIGPAARSLEPRLRELLGRPDENGWRHVALAEALWRVTGDAATALSGLAAAWEANPMARTKAARCMAKMGEAAAALAPLLEAELAETRRHTTLLGASLSHAVPQDEALLRACREALAAIGGRPAEE